MHAHIGRTRRTKLLAAAGAAALVVGLGSIGAPAALADSASPTPAAAAATPTTFTIGMTTDIDSANPFTGIVAEAYEVFQLMYPTLTEYAADDFSTAPGIADSWTESADKKTWTYKIHPGLKWSDGQPMTAADAAYSINRVKTGKYEGINYGSYVQNVIKATATDPTTLVVTVKRPTPIMEHLTVYILPEHIWKDISETEVKKFKNEPTPGNPIVSGGPYVFTERQVGQFIRLEANPNYWRGKPAVSEVVFRVYGNDDAMAQALKKGEIDFADNLPPNVFKSLQGVDGITTVPAVYSGFDEIAFNTGAALSDGTPIGDGNPLLKDVKLRQAIGWAIDRQTLLRQGPRRPRVAGVHDHPPDLRQPAPRPGQPGHLRPGEGEVAAGRRGLQGRQRRRARGTRRQQALLPPVRPLGLLDVEEVGRVHQGLPRRGRDRGRGQQPGQQPADREDR